MKKITILFINIIVFGALNLAEGQNADKEKISPALLVIDVQKAFIGMMDQTSIDESIVYINAYIESFNQLDFPVIYIYHANENQGVAIGSEGYKYIDKIPVPDDAIIVNKKYMNAFNKTELDKILKELKCNTLFLCGLSAAGCVYGTWVGGLDLDYETYVLQQAVMSHDTEVTKMIEDITHSIGPVGMKLTLENIAD